MLTCVFVVYFQLTLTARFIEVHVEIDVFFYQKNLQIKAGACEQLRIFG